MYTRTFVFFHKKNALFRITVLTSHCAGTSIVAHCRRSLPIEIETRGKFKCERGRGMEKDGRMVVARVVGPCSMRGLDERRGISLVAATGLTFFARSHATQYTLVDDKRQPPRPPRVATPVRQATRRCSRAIVTISSGERRMRSSKFKSRAQGHRSRIFLFFFFSLALFG